jgi:TatD DNase family protein
MIFDTHAHYDDEQFSNDLDDLMEEMRPKVAAIIDCAVDYDSAEKILSLSKKYDNIYAAVGVFPESCDKAGDFDKERLCRMLSDKKAVAVGEIGLDYYWEDNPKRETQIEWAENQIMLANELNLPISFHDREAHGDTIDLIRKHRPRGVLHCFSGSVQMAKEIVSYGMHIGVGGVVTFKNAKKAVEVVRALPLEAIVLETDAPYLSPEPYRGKRNRSDYIEFVANRVADIKGISAEKVLKQTCETAEKIFLEGIK